MVLSNMENILSVQKSIMLSTGLWPKKDASILHVLKEIIGFVLIVVLFIFMSIEVIQCLNDFFKLSSSLFLFTSFLGYLFKYLSYRTNRKLFIKVLKSFNDVFFKHYPEKYDYITQAAITKSSVLSRLYVVSCSACVLCFGIFPMLDKEPLPIKSAYFHNGPLHIPFYLIEWAGLAICACNNLSMDLTVSGLMQVAATQLKILSEKLKDAEENVEMFMKDYQLSSERKIIQYLSHCSIHYEKISELVKDIETIFTVGLFAQFCCSIIVICNTGFNFLFVPLLSIQFLSLFFYFVSMMAELTMYCWFGNEIILGSKDIAESCYMSKWYNFEPKAGKILFILMERSKKPLTISTYKFSVLSLAAFTSIMNWSYSYFTLLRRLYGDNS